MSFSEPVGIVFFGGVKINALENTASFNVGDVFLQSFDSQVKNNLNAGQIYGDFDWNNVQAIASPIYDPDGFDTIAPANMKPLGLED
jgi:hypothetical protein